MHAAKQGDYVRTRGGAQRVGHVTGYSRFSDNYHVQWQIDEPSRIHKRDDFMVFGDQVKGKAEWLAQCDGARDRIRASNMEG